MAKIAKEITYEIKLAENLFAGQLGIQTIYADFIGPLILSSGSVRTSLVRVDTELFARDAQPQLTPVAQIVLSERGFIETTLKWMSQIEQFCTINPTFAATLKQVKDDIAAKESAKIQAQAKAEEEVAALDGENA